MEASKGTGMLRLSVGKLSTSSQPMIKLRSRKTVVAASLAIKLIPVAIGLTTAYECAHKSLLKSSAFDAIATDFQPELSQETILLREKRPWTYNHLVKQAGEFLQKIREHPDDVVINNGSYYGLGPTDLAKVIRRLAGSGMICVSCRNKDLENIKDGLTEALGCFYKDIHLGRLFREYDIFDLLREASARYRHQTGEKTIVMTDAFLWKAEELEFLNGFPDVKFVMRGKAILDNFNYSLTSVPRDALVEMMCSHFKVDVQEASATYDFFGEEELEKLESSLVLKSSLQGAKEEFMSEMMSRYGRAGFGRVSFGEEDTFGYEKQKELLERMLEAGEDGLSERVFKSYFFYRDVYFRHSPEPEYVKYCYQVFLSQWPNLISIFKPLKGGRYGFASGAAKECAKILLANINQKMKKRV